jgi:3-methyladenine DNA glycosylase AlkD
VAKPGGKKQRHRHKLARNKQMKKKADRASKPRQPGRPGLTALRQLLRAAASSEKARLLQRFFKTGPGEYGEGDVFLGVTVPITRRVSRQSDGLALSEVRILLRSRFHEERLLALLILVRRFERGDHALRQRLFTFYLQHLRCINNWDLVDLSAPRIIGAWLLGRDRSVLDRLSQSEDLWERRVAVLATFAFLPQDDFDDALRLCRRLLGDQHDLIHKACGWLLREVGKRNLSVLEAFLEAHARQMPRTTLRYAIERMSSTRRRFWMSLRPLKPTHP